MSGRLPYTPEPESRGTAVRFVPEWSTENGGYAMKNAGRSKGGHVGVMVEQSLLDLLSIQMKCEYLSDLRFLSQEQRRYLAQRLDRLTPREEDVREWNDALIYLTGASPEDTAQAAKARLLYLLSQPCEAR